MITRKCIRTPTSGALTTMILVIVAACLATPSSRVLAQTTDSFTIGNLNDPVGQPVPGIFQAAEIYAFHVYPPDQCLCTEGGFAPLSISQLLSFDASQVPATFQVEARLLQAVYDPANNCYTPGPMIYNGSPVSIEIGMPGIQQITAPFPSFPPVTFIAHYFLSLKYTGNASASLAIDNQPQVCTDFIDRGNGWEDLFFFPGKTGGGKSIIFGDIVCGALSVDTETGSWGTIKSLYR